LNAVRITTDRLCTEYRYRPAHDLRLEGQDWLRRITRLLDERLTYRQHGDVLAVAGMLALLVGCVEYDTGDAHRKRVGLSVLEGRGRVALRLRLPHDGAWGLARGRATSGAAAS
jgi:hypothetical protein